MASESNVTVSKNDLQNAAGAIERDADKIARKGVEDLEEAASDFDAARDLRDAAVITGVAGVADVTRAEDLAIVAKQVGLLGEIVGAAGVRDAAEGIEMLAASEDIETMSA